MVIHMWDASTGRIQQQFAIEPDTLFDMISVSADGSEIYAVVMDANDRYAIRYWDVETGADLRRIELPFTGPAELRVVRPQTRIWLNRPTPDAPDELALVTLPDAPAQLWDLRRMEMVREFEGASGRIGGAQFSPSQRYIAMGVPTSEVIDAEFEMRVWEVDTGALVWSFGGFTGGGLAIDSFAFSADDRFLITGNTSNARRTELWDLATGESVRTWETGGVSTGISPDGETIALAHFFTGVVEVYPRVEMTLPQRLRHPDRVRGVAYSHDGRLIATAGGDGIIRLWDTQTFREVRMLIGHPDPVTEIRFSPDDRYMLSTGWNDGYRLWDVQTGQQVWEHTGHIYNRFTPAFTSDGQYMIAIDTDEHEVRYEIQVVEVGVGTIVARASLPDGTFIVNCARFSPDDRYIAVMKGDVWKNAFLWDWRSGNPPREILNDANVPTRCGAFTPDGSYLLLGGNDGILRVHDIATGVELRRLFGLEGGYLEVVFSPDGTQVLATGDSDVRIWDYATGEEVRRFTFEGTIWGGAYSPDGSAIVLGSFDGDGAYIVRADLNQEVMALCARLTRDFTDAEREQYGITDRSPTCPQPGESFPVVAINPTAI